MRRSLVILSLSALLIATAASLAFVRVDRDGLPATTYPSVAELGRALNEAGAGCRAVGPLIGELFVPPGRQGGYCEVGGEGITIWVATTSADTRRIQQMPDPKHWYSVTWVRGPNWLVATMKRDAAVAVQHAIGGQLHGADL